MQERNTILIVDDQETNRAILHRLLEDQFIILEAEDGLEAIEQINGHEKELALIMLDIIMPNMNGYDVLHFMENASIDENIPVILITGDIETIAELKEYQSHIAEVVMKPFDIRITRRRVYHTIELYEWKRKELEKEQKTQKAGNTTKTFQTAGQLAMEEKQNKISEKPRFEATEKIRLESENLELKDRYALLEKENQKSKEQYAQLEKAYKESEQKCTQLGDRYTRSEQTILKERTKFHDLVQKYKDASERFCLILSRKTGNENCLLRVKAFTEILCKYVMQEYPEYHLTRQIVVKIIESSVFYDVGMFMIGDDILKKPGKLTKKERAVMEEHTKKGVEVLKYLDVIADSDTLTYASDICLYHHERYDGNGYPHGLAGDEIPIAAQIVSVAEAYAALLRKGSYRDAYSQVNAEKMILDGQCGCFNPKLLDCFELGKEEMRAVIIKTAESERIEQE